MSYLAFFANLDISRLFHLFVRYTVWNHKERSYTIMLEKASVFDNGIISVFRQHHLNYFDQSHVYAYIKVKFSVNNAVTTGFSIESNSLIEISRVL